MVYRKGGDSVPLAKLALTIFVYLVANSVSAAERRDIENAVYCVGLYESDINELSENLGPKVAYAQEAELKRQQKHVIVDNAIRNGKIRAATAKRKRAFGYVDGKGCSTQQENCIKRWYDRAEKKVDHESNQEALIHCNDVSARLCGRAYEKCN